MFRYSYRKWLARLRSLAQRLRFSAAGRLLAVFSPVRRLKRWLGEEDHYFLFWFSVAMLLILAWMGGCTANMLEEGSLRSEREAEFKRIAEEKNLQIGWAEVDAGVYFFPVCREEHPPGASGRCRQYSDSGWRPSFQDRLIEFKVASPDLMVTAVMDKRYYSYLGYLGYLVNTEKRR